MKLHTGKKVLLSAVLIGVFMGVLYANFMADTYLSANGFFSSFFLEEFSNTQIDKSEFMFYLIRIRIVPFALLMVCGMTGLRKSAAAFFLIWHGFLLGVLSVTSVIQLGIKGLILCIVAMLPQIIFYILAYSVVIWGLFTWPNAKWTTTKTTFIVLTFVLGIVTEVYVNPLILKLYLKVL